MPASTARVARLHLKRASGFDFFVYMEGHNPKRLFHDAQAEAGQAHREEWESDHHQEDDPDHDRDYNGREYEGGSGSIAEKHDFVMRGPGAMTEQEADDFASKDLRNNDDWGPAFCIEVVDPAGKQVGYLFYGIASS